MNVILTARMSRAIARIGGPLSVLALPEEVKQPIINCTDYETRVKMLELVADRLEGKTTENGD